MKGDELDEVSSRMPAGPPKKPKVIGRHRHEDRCIYREKNRSYYLIVRVRWAGRLRNLGPQPNLTVARAVRDAFLASRVPLMPIKAGCVCWAVSLGGNRGTTLNAIIADTHSRMSMGSNLKMVLACLLAAEMIRFEEGRYLILPAGLSRAKEFEDYYLHSHRLRLPAEPPKDDYIPNPRRPWTVED